VLAKPQTFMNLSGGPVAELAGYFGATPDTVIVVHDDIDLPAWEIRLKRGGGEGGHNGLRDISKALGTKEYIRVRCGVGRPPGRQDAAAYVLADFPASLRPDVALLVDKAADAVERVVLEGLGAAQLAFHTPPRSPSGDRLVGGSTVPVCCVSAGESPAPTASTQAEGVVQHPPKGSGDDSPAAVDGESGGPETAREGGGPA
jgi:hypothetical protein